MKTSPTVTRGRAGWSAAWRSLAARLGAFRKDAGGAMAITAGLFTVLILGIAVLALDVGRMVVLRTQLQNAADAVALAAAVQLTGVDGSMTLATAVATNAAQNSTNFIGGGTTFTIASTAFYRDWTSGSPGSGNAATDDSNASIVMVTMTSQTLNLVLQPILNVMTGTSSSDTTVMTAYAVGQNAAVSCEQTPLMICNPYEGAGCGDVPSENFYDLDKIGREFTVKEGPGGSSGAPGQFGLLALPDGASGASALGSALADITQDDCQGPYVTTAPGSKTNQIVWGLQTRFDASTKYDNAPAPNIFEYPDDGSATDEAVSDGDWDPSAHINAYHGGITPTGLTLDTLSTPQTPTRYQMYLYEIGVTFAVGDNGNSVMSITQYPTLDSDGDSLVPSGFTAVNGSISSPTTIPFDQAIPATYDRIARGTDPSDPDYVVEFDEGTSGDPADSETWVKRRVVKSSVLDCNCLGVSGAGTYEMGGRVMEIFLLKPPEQPPGDASLWGEIVGYPTAGSGYGGSSEDIVRNVKLIE